MKTILLFLIMYSLFGCTSPLDIEGDDYTEYSVATAYYDSAQYELAIASYKKIIEESPYSDKVDNAMYYMGRSFYKLAFERYEMAGSFAINMQNAITVFDNVNSNSSLKIKGDYWAFLARSNLYFFDATTYEKPNTVNMKSYAVNYPNFPYLASIADMVKDIESDEYSLISAYYAVDVLYAMGNYTKAATQIVAADTTNLAKYSSIAYRFAMTNYHLNEYGNAAQFFEYITADYINYDEALYWSGVSFYKLKEYEKSLEKLNLYRALFPQGSKIGSVSDYILLAEGKL